MPEWFHPILNESLAIGVVGFGCWLGAWLAKYFAPVLKAKQEAAAERERAQAHLADSLRVTMERFAIGQEQVGKTLDGHTETLAEHRTLLERIHDSVNPCPRIFRPPEPHPK